MLRPSRRSIPAWRRTCPRLKRARQSRVLRTTPDRSRPVQYSWRCAATRSMASRSRTRRSRAEPSRCLAEAPPPADCRVPWIQVADARLALAALSASYFGRPSEKLQLVGITGTNGKTTTSYVVQSIFESAGIRCGRIGTVGYRVGNREFEAARTTPEAPELHRMLRDMVSQGCGACVMEVSSHALALRRADHLRFAAAIFTNLTRDHLDFHRDMEDYFIAKRRLFELLPPGGFRHREPRRSARRESSRPFRRVR